MILNKLTLDNYGVFAGQCELDFCPRTKHGKKRPLILIGGKNGAGKSTIFEAIQICLYGPAAFGNLLSKKQYDSFLKRKVHRSKDVLIPNTYASIALEFEHVHSGVRTVYEITRQWELKGTRVIEELLIQKDNEDFEDLEYKIWQDFLKELIPPGLSQLFFFDGEKIQNLAEGNESKMHLGESIKALLGLDFVEKLNVDLSIFKNKKTKAAQNIDVQDQIDQTENSLVEIRANLSNEEDEQCKINASINDLKVEIDQQELKLSSEGGNFAHKRKQITEERNRLQERLILQENSIKDLCAGLLPFLLIKEHMIQLKNQLLSEDSFAKWESTVKQVDELRAKTTAEISPVLADTKEDLRNSVLNKLEEVFDGFIAPPSHSKDFTSILNVTEDDKSQMLSWIKQLENDTPKSVKKSQNDLERVYFALKDAESTLTKVPSEDAVAPFVKELNALNKELGSLEQQRKRIEANISKLQNKELDTVRKKTKRYEELQKQAHQDRNMKLLEKTQIVLKEYLNVLTTARVEKLEKLLTENLNTLSHKGDRISRIEINPSSFAVDLFNRSGARISKSELSAGEKQMYAISMLWSLASLSGRPLPVIVDTPLGRLDSDHRAHLVDKYFPFASHQVILLSTDTEVDKNYYDSLSPHISHAYHLEYDNQEETTTVQEEYFWRRKETASASK